MVKTKNSTNTTNNNNKGVSFCFTDFNKLNIENGYNKIYDEFKDVIRGIAWGKEVCPKTGREHNQGYVQMFSQSRYTAIQKMIKSKCHFEVMFGSINDNEAYCSKENRYTKLGAFVSRGYRSDMHSIKDEIKNGASLYDIMENYTGQFVRMSNGITKMKELIDEKKSQEWRDVKVTTLTGEAGVGKTSYVYKKYGYAEVFTIDGGCDPKFLFNGYAGQDVLLIDDFNGWVKYTTMLRILDGHPLPLNVKNGRTFARWTKIYITSNVVPRKWYLKIYENFKRRIHECLLVTKGNTEPLVNPWDYAADDSDTEEYCE